MIIDALKIFNITWHICNFPGTYLLYKERKNTQRWQQEKLMRAFSLPNVISSHFFLTELRKSQNTSRGFPFPQKNPKKLGY